MTNKAGSLPPVELCMKMEFVTTMDTTPKHVAEMMLRKRVGPVATTNEMMHDELASETVPKSTILPVSALPVTLWSMKDELVAFELRNQKNPTYPEQTQSCRSTVRLVADM